MTGRRAGTVKVAAIAADGSGIRAEIDVRVVIPVEECWMEPASASLFVGETSSLRVNGRPGNATLHAPTDFTWESSDESVATVDSRGLVTATGFGAATITATSHNGLKSTCEVIVSVAVASIDISPVDVEEPIVEVEGDALRLQAVGYDKNESTENVAQSFTWTSSNTSIATVTVGEDDIATVTGLRPGTVTITVAAKDGSKTRATLQVTVIAPVQDFTIPATARVVIGETTTLSLTVSPANSTYGERDDFTWESGDEKIVTVDKTGVVTGVALGTATITVTSHNGIEKQCQVTVTNPTNTVTIAPVVSGQTEVAVGEEMALSAVAYGKDGTTDEVAQDFDWTTSNSAIATVKKNADGTATVTGVKAGTVTITAATTDGSGIRGRYSITVIVAVKDFTIPETTRVVIGETTTLSLTVSPTNATYDSRTDFTWESGDEKIITVNENGVVTGVALGTATVTVTSHNGIEKQCQVTVTNPTNTVKVAPVDPENAELIAGEKDLVLEAVAYGKDGTTDDVAQDFDWTTSNSAVATVKKGEDGSTATVTGLKAGTATITATTTDGSDISGKYVVTVIVPVTGLTLPKEATLPIVNPLDLGAQLEFEPADATLRDVEWSSSDESIAIVNANGVVTGLKAGDVVITAAAKSDPEVTASCKVTVKRLPDSIDIEPVGGHIPYGDNTVLVYIPYGDGERNVHYRGTSSVTFNFIPDDEYVLSDTKWQVYSGANRVSAARNEDGSVTITARTNSLSSSESQATVVIRAASTYDDTIMGTYNIVLARGISWISMADLRYDYNTTTSFRVPQPTIQPANATFKNSSDFIWMSSNPDVVSISEGGQCTINGTGVAYISMCPKYDYGYINGGSPSVTGGFSVTVLKKAKSVVIAMVNDELDEVISIGEGVAPHGGNVQLLAVALEEDYTLEDIEAGRLPAAGQRFTWSVSNTSQASIRLDDAETGFCLVHCGRTTGNGYVTLTAKTQDGSGVVGTFRLRIVPAITEIKGILEELVLRVGEKYTFEPTIVPADAQSPDLFWHNIKERDAHIASMDGNTVTALSPGTVMLTIAPVGQQNTANGVVNAQCELTVVSDDPASMRIDGAQDGQTLRIGDVLDLSATMLAADGSSEGVDQKVTWDFSFEDVWIPNKDGVLEHHPDGEALAIDDETGELTAVGTGVATITATARSKTADGKTLSKTITVYIQGEKITGIPEEIVLTPGETYTFKPALEPASESASFTWGALSETDKAVISLDGNTVTALSAGSATLTLTAEGVNGKATCTVKVANKPSSVTLTGLEEGQRLAMGDKVQLTATVLDENGSTENISQEIIWDCSNWDVADVENGLVAPFSMGEITITAASAADPDVKASVTVYVGMDRIEGIPAELTLYAGQTYTFEPTLSGSPADFVWRALSEADAKVVSIKGNDVTAIAEGKAKVTVEAADLKGLIASCSITVLPAQEVHSVEITGAEEGQEIVTGTTVQLTAKALAADGTQNGLLDTGITWSTSDEKVGNISDEGLLTAMSPGEVTITATSKANPEVSKSLHITCVAAPEEEETEQEG